jgi:predicted Zn-dependent protease
MNTPSSQQLFDVSVETSAGTFTVAQLADIQRRWMDQASQAESIPTFLASVGLDSSALAAMENLALRDYRAGQYESARRQFAHLCRLNPGEGRLIKSLAACQQALGCHAQALLGYREALMASPDDLSCLLHSAQCLLHLGRKADAARVLSALIDAPMPTPWHERARLLMGLCGEGDATAPKAA